MLTAMMMPPSVILTTMGTMALSQLLSPLFNMTLDSAASAKDAVGSSGIAQAAANRMDTLYEGIGGRNPNQLMMRATWALPPVMAALAIGHTWLQDTGSSVPLAVLARHDCFRGDDDRFLPNDSKLATAFNSHI